MTNSTIADSADAALVVDGSIPNSSSEAVLTNCTVVYNDGGFVNSVDVLLGGGDLTLNNTVVWGNGSDWDHQAGMEFDGANNYIPDGPGYADPMLTPWTDADGTVLYYLTQPGSPLIDAGDNALAVDPNGVPLVTDQIGRARILDGTVDIGAVEYKIAGDLDGDGTVGIYDLNMVLIDWGKSGAAISDPRSDGDGSGTVDIIDLNIVLIDWGK